MPSDRVKRRSRSRSPPCREQESNRRNRYDEVDERESDKDPERKKSKISRREIRSYSSDRERERDRYRDGGRDRDRDRDRDWDRDRDRNRDEGRDRGGDRGRDRDRSRDRSRDRDRDRERDRERERDRDIGRHRDRDRHWANDSRKDRENKDGDNYVGRNKATHQGRSREQRPKHHITQSHSRSHSQDHHSKNPPTTKSPSPPKQTPNYHHTGLLASSSNTLNNTPLKYTEPLDSRLPPQTHTWHLYTFKSSTLLTTTPIHTQPCWLLGRDHLVTDIPLDHPSISKQHAVIQFRHITKTNQFGDKKSLVKPYIVDLDSANKTFLNGEEIPEKRFVELKSGDVIKFGLSTREYVIMFNDEKK